MKRKGIKSILKNHAKAQIMSLDTVVPYHTYDPAYKTLFIDSPAGHLKIKFSNPVGVAHYRNKYLNRFDQIVDDKEYFKLYKEIQKDKTYKTRITYTANIRTRLKGGICNLLSWG